MNIFSSFRNLILPVADINNILPSSGFIYEIGSGWGSLAAELARNYPQRHLVALDIDSVKVENTKNKYRYHNLSFEKADALKYQYRDCDGAVLSDFLHHLPFTTQEILLIKLTQRLKPGGFLLIKEIDADDGWRKWLSRFWDKLLYPKDRIYYRNKEDWIKLLGSLGWNVRVSQKVPWFPGSTHLFVCKKK